MASDAVEQLIGEVEALTSADHNIARIWVRDAFKRILRFRQWSFLTRRGSLVVPAAITSDSTAATCSIAQGGTRLDFTSAIATDEFVGRQFRSGTALPICDISGRLSATSVVLREPWYGAALTAAPFTIFKPYLDLPRECKQLITVVNPSIPRPLRLNYQREVLDAEDPGRTRDGSGEPSLLCPLDWSQRAAGVVDPAVRVYGAGAKPVSGGVYSGQNDALFAVRVTTGGAGAVVVFAWRKEEGAETTGAAANTTAGNVLSDDVRVLWDAATIYTSGDIFVIPARAASLPGSIRQEIYPAPLILTILPMVYSIGWGDITEDADVPGLFAERLDIIREKALEFAASAPGSPYGQGAGYSQINRREYHAATCFALLRDLANEDNLLCQRDARLAGLPTSGYTGDPQIYDQPYYGNGNGQSDLY